MPIYTDELVPVAVTIIKIAAVHIAGTTYFQLIQLEIDSACNFLWASLARLMSLLALVIILSALVITSSAADIISKA